jgi:RNA polymerase sigma-70 factor (ECF subfamily)
MQFRDDKYYIDKILRGDVNAFSYLVEKHKRMAYTLALKLVTIPEDAEEIAQDAFVKAFQSLKEFKGESKFSTWLYKIVYHVSISRLRKKTLEIISIDDDHYRNFDVCETDHFLTQLSVEEQNALVRSAIGRLPAEERALVTLYYLNENTVKEITIITGDSESNVKIKLFRARKKLWELLKYRFKDQIIEQYDEKR